MKAWLVRYLKKGSIPTWMVTKLFLLGIEHMMPIDMPFWTLDVEQKQLLIAGFVLRVGPCPCPWLYFSTTLRSLAHPTFPFYKLGFSIIKFLRYTLVFPIICGHVWLFLLNIQLNLLHIIISIDSSLLVIGEWFFHQAWYWNWTTTSWYLHVALEFPSSS